jgi:hypothetical protein
MATITITCTGEQKVYHDHWKPFVCTTDSEIPDMYNAGMNHFLFIGGQPNFIGQNMPEIVKLETENYIFYECSVEVVGTNDVKVSGQYIKTLDKRTNTITSEQFCFN